MAVATASNGNFETVLVIKMQKPICKADKEAMLLQIRYTCLGCPKM